MNGGPIGGIDQSGTWKLDARFNKSELEVRCKKVAEYSRRIHVSQTDALDFIIERDQKMFSSSSTLLTTLRRDALPE